MASSAKLNFVRQQGFEDASPAACGAQHSALVFQPRIVGVIVAGAILAQAWYIFLPLGALLWWNAVVPAANPFDALYNVLLARSGRRPKLEPAPPPRRFAQGMAGTFMIVIGLSIVGGAHVVAWVFEALVVLAFGLILFGKFCLGSYIYYLIRGRKDFAHRTLPWSGAE